MLFSTRVGISGLKCPGVLPEVLVRRWVIWQLASCTLSVLSHVHVPVWSSSTLSSLACFGRATLVLDKRWIVSSLWVNLFDHFVPFPRVPFFVVAVVSAGQR